jgi:hydrogenase expression/formation protein HypC
MLGLLCLRVAQLGSLCLDALIKFCLAVSLLVCALATGFSVFVLILCNLVILARCPWLDKNYRLPTVPICLAVPGPILAIGSAGEGDVPLWCQAEEDFEGVRQTVSLACLSEAQVGDPVLVHVGLALSLVEDDDPFDDNESVARVIFRLSEAIG